MASLMSEETDPISTVAACISGKHADPLKGEERA
jgi:hypothetical protein